MVLSPLLRLSPEEVTFPSPIKLTLPICIGAQKAFRSTESGWEEIPMLLRDGTAEVILNHFCDVFVAGGRAPLKALGFINVSTPMGKLAITHVGCDACDENLEFLERDRDFLREFQRCTNPKHLGAYTDEADLIYSQEDGAPQSVSLMFAAFPLLLEPLACSTEDLDITLNRIRCRFCRPPSSATVSWIRCVVFFACMWFRFFGGKIIGTKSSQ